MALTYGIIAVLLLIAELVYFKIADHFNIIDKPNERSRHSTIVLRGGGIIFSLSMIVWAVMMVVQGQAHRKHAYQLMANELKKQSENGSVRVP